MTEDIRSIEIKPILEAALFAAGEPLTIERLMNLFVGEVDKPIVKHIRQALELIQTEYETRPVALVEVASGFTFRVKQDYAGWLIHLWEEKAPRYSRATLETLALIAYRQPVTRTEIEEVRGVSVATYILKTLQDRQWIKIVGHREVPGRPALYATTKEFLDYFNLKSLSQLPPLAEVRDLEAVARDAAVQLDLPGLVEADAVTIEEASEVKEAIMVSGEQRVEESVEEDLMVVTIDDDA